MTHGHIYDMIIVGGGPGRLYRRPPTPRGRAVDTLVLEKLSAGGQMALTQQIDNYPGFEDSVDGFTLAEKMQAQAERFGARTEYAQVERRTSPPSPRCWRPGRGPFWARQSFLPPEPTQESWVWTTRRRWWAGAWPTAPPVTGCFTGARPLWWWAGATPPPQTPCCSAALQKRVILVHRRDALRATKIYHEPLKQAENLEFRWNSAITGLLYGDRLTGVQLKNLNSGEVSNLDCDGLFISVGRTPATELVRGQLELDPGGYILAGETTETSIPGVFAVGDVRTKRLRQVVTAVSDGAVAVHMAEEYLAGGT